jgi:hypothetical protein
MREILYLWGRTCPTSENSVRAKFGGFTSTQPSEES